MKPFQLLRDCPYLRSTSQQTFNAASRTRPNSLNPLTCHPSSSSRRPLSNLLTRAPRRKPPFSAHNTPIRRPYSTRPPPNSNSNNPSPHGYNPTPNLNSPPPPPPPPLSLSQRLRKLSREYGWSAFAVYMLFTALDFPFCFAAVRYLGADRVGRYEHAVVEWAKSAVPEAWRERVSMVVAGRQDEEDGQGQGEDGERGAVAVAEVGGVITGYDHGVREAEKRNNETENASIWTQLALAYAIHKSFIFIRVPLTVAATPKVVKVLRSWGWDIGKRRPKGVVK